MKILSLFLLLIFSINLISQSSDDTTKPIELYQNLETSMKSRIDSLFEVMFDKMDSLDILLSDKFDPHYFLNPGVGLDTLFSDTSKISEETTKTIILVDSAYLDTIYLGLIGGADIQKIIGSSDDNIPAAFSIGIDFRQVYKNSDDIKFVSDLYSITNINSSPFYDSIVAEYNSDGQITNVSDFGDFILLPFNSRYSASSYLTAYFYQDKRKRTNNKVGFSDIFYGLFSGFHAEAVAGQKVFVFDSASINTVGLSLRLGLFHEFIPDKIRLKSNLSFLLGIDFTQRHIFGDLGQNNNDDFTESTFGTAKKSFFGIETYVNFRYQSLFIETTIPSLWQKPGEDIQGLTMTRFIIKIKFVGSLPLFRKK